MRFKQSETGRRCMGVAGGVLGAAVLAFSVWIIFLSNVSVSLTDTALELSGGVGDKAVLPYTEISSVEWRDTFEKGSRTWGTGTLKISTGTFSNGEWGKYQLFFHNDVPCAVVVHGAHGAVTVFNGETYQQTQTLYEALYSRIAPR